MKTTSKKIKLDTWLMGIIVTTVFSGIITIAALTAAFMIYPHIAQNPYVNEFAGWTAAEILYAQMQSEALITFGTACLYLTIALLGILLLTIWIDGHLSSNSPHLFF